MPSYGMLHIVVLIITDVSEERRASIIGMTRFGQLGTMLAVFLRSVRCLLVAANVPSSLNLVTLMMKALLSSETSVITGATLHNITEYGILRSH
jgi:hypothetical protein